MMDFKSPEITALIQTALAEDIGPGDYSSLASIRPETRGESKILFKQDGILAGMELARQILWIVDSGIQFETFFKDGDFIAKGTLIARANGRVHSLLKAERLLLNFMQRLSAIATQTREVAQLLAPYPVKVLDTRKTTPGLRILEKWAVKIGGGHNHRIGLYDMIMLKDNHIDSAGGITAAVNSTKEYLQQNHLNLKIEVETRNLKEVQEALGVGGVDRIMLDNFSPEMCAQAVQIIQHKVETEASGGISFSNIVDYAKAGVDYISLGYLTHSVKALDISMKTRCQ
jgi:nicotinate-nucleotide pyrophosphorylase (carboxylating)